MKRILLLFIAASCMATASRAYGETTRGPSVSPLPSRDQWQRLEDELQQVTHQIVARRRALLQQQPELQAAQQELAAARTEMERRTTLIPAVQSLDAAHRDKLKDYGAMEAKFNRLRAHWTTHAKSAVGTNGQAVAAARPFPACAYCQKDFDRFVAGDPAIVQEYKTAADQLLAQMQNMRQGLTSFSVSRRDAVREALAADPKLSELAARIESMERNFVLAAERDPELAAMVKQLEGCREKIKALDSTRDAASRSLPVSRS